MKKNLTNQQLQFLQKVLDSGLLQRLPHNQLPDFAQGLDITELIERDYWFQTNITQTIEKAIHTGMYENDRHLNVVGIMWVHKKEIFTI